MDFSETAVNGDICSVRTAKPMQVEIPRQHRPDVRREPQRVQNRKQIEQCYICGI
jgi:hypothetical protein